MIQGLDAAVLGSRPAHGLKQVQEVLKLSSQGQSRGAIPERNDFDKAELAQDFDAGLNARPPQGSC
ncbi:MAG: hypothetical protein FJ336_04515 [Sphingomonadales bacterium]|nr:hypothetical protein [Sphingomonadales bacterium]